LRSFHQTLRHRTAPCWTVRRVQGVEADECAGQVEEPEQDVRAPLVADLQPPVADQPRQRPLHHVPVAAQPLARLDAAPGDPGRDAAPAQRQTAARVVVPLVAMQLGRALAGRPRGPLTGGTASTTAGIIAVGVGGRQPCGQRDAAPVDQQVVLGAGLAAVCRVRAGQAAPRLARTLKLSRLARNQSSWPWRPSWSSSTWWSCCHTPARCQSRSRRQQVTGLPQPSWSTGSSPQGTPVRSW
jgi:hypothetical protein